MREDYVKQKGGNDEDMLGPTSSCANLSGVSFVFKQFHSMCGSGNCRKRKAECIVPDHGVGQSELLFLST